MRYRLKYTDKALQDLESIDEPSVRRIVDKLDFFIAQPSPLRYAKQLQNSRFGEFRFRVGEYRVLFDLYEGSITILMILRVKHRKEAYGL